MDAKIRGEATDKNLVKSKMPILLELTYTLQLEAVLPGLAQTLKDNGIFDAGCRWWLDQQIKKGK